MNATFIQQLIERAVKTAAQAALALLTAGSLDWFHLDWKAALSTVATAAAASVLTSLLSLRLGPPDSPSVVPTSPPASETPAV